ncbi:uncharacterized protein NEMAJ01_0663 [Nematocida major]|uniref:uncharacterized protein n=1 Tax=Nematocida major TaxID=1912982 RepID=UPI0020086A61|nr:uncharacterized protein NEMAJ01_0663 [Nematocida major]KAH9385767.1 hypothetical protein NEMAJ01_0663 [Nematocida major]
MIIRKLKALQSKLLKQKGSRKETQKKEEPPVEPLSVEEYMNRKQMATEKRYFDSADHFLKLHEKEQIRQKELECDAEKEKSLQPAPAPLETAYSEIIDEMKPKESV